MPTLIVVAHPDDEVLGCGGMASALTSKGTEVRACILCGEVDARRNRPPVSELHAGIDGAQRILGMPSAILGHFSNIQFNTVPHVELVQFIEAQIESSGADTILTHHPNDVNDDHRHTSRACQAAVRLFQRRPGIAPLRALYFMEILSATDWTMPSGEQFRADTFFEIGESGLECKVRALGSYAGVLRDFPHPRSPEVIRGLAAYRGGQAGMRYAEAFQTAFSALSRTTS